MRLREVAERLGLTRLTPELAEKEEADVTQGHASDLLSDVLANAPRGGVLVTIQAHLNVVAVAVHAELGAVVFAGNRRPEEAVRSRAVAEGIPLFASAETTFTLAGRLYELGLRGGARRDR